MPFPWSGFMAGDYEGRMPPTPNYQSVSPAQSSFLFNQLTADNPGTGRKLIIALNLAITGGTNPQVTSLLVNGEPAIPLYRPTATSEFNGSFWLINNEADAAVDLDVTTSIPITNIVVDLWSYFGGSVAPLSSAAGGVIASGASTTINLTAPAGSTVFATEFNKVPNNYSNVFALHKSYAVITPLSLTSPGGSTSALAATLTLDRTTSNIVRTGNDLYCQRLTAVALSNT